MRLGSAGRLARAGAFAGLVLAACDSPTIPGREGEAYPFASPPRFEGDRSLVIRWPAGRTVRVWLDAGGQQARARLLEQAFAQAAASWNDAVLYREYRLARAARLEDADVVIRFSDFPPPVQIGGCPPLLQGHAVTTFCLDPNHGSRLAVFPLASGPVGQVRMLVTVLASEAARPGRLDQLVVHELGHVLGIIPHSGERTDVMWGSAEQVRPSAADRATMQVLYHTPPDVTP